MRCFSSCSKYTRTGAIPAFSYTLHYDQVAMFLLQEAAKRINQPFFFDGWYDVRRTVTLSVMGFAALIIMLRVSGKRTLSKLNVFDFVFVVAVGSVFASMIISKDVTLVEGVAAMATLMLIQLV